MVATNWVLIARDRAAWDLRDLSAKNGCAKFTEKTPYKNEVNMGQSPTHKNQCAVQLTRLTVNRLSVTYTTEA